MSIFTKALRKAKRWFKKPSLNSIYRDARKVRDELEEILWETTNPRLAVLLDEIRTILEKP